MTLNWTRHSGGRLTATTTVSERKLDFVIDGSKLTAYEEGRVVLVAGDSQDVLFRVAEKMVLGVRN